MSRRPTSIFAIFNDQDSTCNGDDVDFATESDVLGASYMDGEWFGKGDFELVRLIGPPHSIPGYYFGWTTSEPLIGTDVVAIHHPHGASTHISFGSRSLDASVTVDGELAPASFYYRVQLAQGIVEPGSSGSPCSTRRIRSWAP